MTSELTVVIGVGLDAIALFLALSFGLSALMALVPFGSGHIHWQEKDARRRLLFPPVGAFILVALGVGSVFWTAYRQGPDHCGAATVHPAHLCWVHPAGSVLSFSTPELMLLLGLTMASGWLVWGLTRYLAAHHQLGTLESLSTPAREKDLAERLADLGLPWAGPLRVVPSDLPLCFVFGVWAPRLVVSTGLLADISDADLRAVIAHESAHVARGDVWWRLACQLAAMTHLPGIGQRAFRRWTFTVEAACDEAAANRLASRMAIAETLVRFQRLLNRRTSKPTPWIAGGMAFDGDGALEGRVKLLLAPTSLKAPHLGWRHWPWAALVLAVWQTETIHGAMEAFLKLLHG